MARPSPSTAGPDYWYLVVPAATEFFASFAAVPSLRAPFGPVPTSVLPFWVGMLCMPGYVTAWLALRSNRLLAPIQRWVVLGSLGLALVCAVAGAVFSAFTIVGRILSIWSGLLTAGMLRRVLTTSRKQATQSTIAEALNESLQLGEVELAGRWIFTEQKMHGDEVAQRIERLTRGVLLQVASCPASGGWDTLFRDPADHRFWERTYPESEVHGGGPPKLSVIEESAARQKYELLMSTSATEEFVVYEGRRAVGARSKQLWDQQRREQYLLRLDVALPISLDRRVLPEALDGDVAVLNLMATVVPANASAAAIAVFRGLELFRWALPQASEWQRLGYDICDAAGISSLSNCGYEPGEREAQPNVALQLNEHHLFREVGHADDFRAASDRRVPEHAPFAVIAMYAKRERSRPG